MPPTCADRLILAACLWLMALGLRLIQLGNHLTKEN